MYIIYKYTPNMRYRWFSAISRIEPHKVLDLLCAIVGSLPLIRTHQLDCGQEWAVSLEMGSWIAFEPAISIEGLAFDVFGKSELLARQASSTL